ncbi:GNAT family N-acetyltransferase [Amycolatopsis pittospori]|uniref:GNAT family N-acetyltransferase n=1 Tax=Amycolatopsis pittospori TaxID=2749434 RepID=UPI0015F09342|nr:GNAT family N-acetyltransferase [Amycolatopsis pittospori]
MTWSFELAAVDHPDAVRILREYMVDIATRYHRRHVPDAEIDGYLEEQHSRDLVPPTGAFLLARRDGVLAGCAGVRVATPDTTELTRVFLRPTERGTGGAALLVAAAEDAARDLGATVMRLDTRSDLVEARALYARLGYAEVEPYNDDPFAQHWFSKPLVRALSDRV